MASKPEVVLSLVLPWATTTDPLSIFAAGGIINGWVFVIFTLGAGLFVSGRMLIRAVSFFGPAAAPEPG
ncbi:MAG: hypothetical protein M3Q89_12880 [Verrucomicrobiota bacterium]|nr:hypothetical protein [Verrucomicrobiota bacterium]